MAVNKLRLGVASLLFLMLSAWHCPAQTNQVRQNRRVTFRLGCAGKRFRASRSPSFVRGASAMLKSYGLANVEHGVPVKPETVFQSGSMGKRFTAAAVMLLVQDGKLSLEDKITKFFPDVPASWGQITVRNLLNHTSGMGDFPPEIDLRRDYTEDEYFASLKRCRSLLSRAQTGITAMPAMSR